MLPEALLAHTGQIYSDLRPTQGCFYDVTILNTERGSFVLKRGRPEELLEEFQLLSALSAYVPFVPAPVAHAEGMFLLTCIDGETMVDALAHADEPGRHHLAAEFGRVLRAVHSWTPPLSRPADWLAEALARAEANLTQAPIDHSGQWGGKEPQAVLAQLRDWAPTVRQDLVFTHGDYCLPNVIVREGKAAGVIDWSAGRYGDRRYDLAAGVWTIRYNMGDESYVRTFLEAYGWTGPAEELALFEALWVLG